MKLPSVLLILFLSTTLGGCTLLAVADAVGSAAVGVATATVKGTVAVVDMAIPDGDDEEENENADEE